EGEIEKLVHMEGRLHERVVGQDEAIEAVATALRRSRAGLQDPDRPIGSFLFLGPTGVGKTELARALAEFMFDSQDAMVRIDMSEYMEKHSVSRLVGAPPGYVGYEEGGQLTEAVRRVVKRVAERGVSVTLTDDAKQLLGNLGYDPAYGARPLRRVIQKQLTDRLALALLQGEIREGDSVGVDAAGGELALEKVGEK